MGIGSYFFFWTINLDCNIQFTVWAICNSVEWQLNNSPKILTQSLVFEDFWNLVNIFFEKNWKRLCTFLFWSWLKWLSYFMKSLMWASFFFPEKTDFSNFFFRKCLIEQKIIIWKWLKVFRKYLKLTKLCSEKAW